MEINKINDQYFEFWEVKIHALFLFFGDQREKIDLKNTVCFSEWMDGKEIELKGRVRLN